jgi:pSer/pThr/pTyr-binding forkhead associated (FHA) protein
MSKFSPEEFLDACGARGPLHLAVSTPSGAAVRVLHQPFVVLGRDPHVDLPLEDPQVSHRHAYFQVIAGGLFAIDLRSRAGTCWPDGPRPAGWLGLQEEVRLGPFAVRHLEGTLDPPRTLDPLATSSFVPAVLPAVYLEFLDDGHVRAVWRMNRRLALVGGRPDCKVRLRDPTISGFHASLVCTPAGLWVVDLFGRGGVAVNGKAVRFARLDGGDRLQIGDCAIRIVGEARSTEPPPAADVRAPLTQVDGSTPTVLLSNADAAPPPEPSGPAAGRLSPSAMSLPAPATALAILEQAFPTATGQALDGPVHSQALVLGLVNQFSQMQQQMFDQFQQTVMSLVCMFRELQAEQADQVRQELDELSRLTHELTELQAEAAERAKPPEPVAPAPPPKQVRHPGAPVVPRPANTGATPKPEKAVKEPDKIHALLCQRMAQLEAERQGHWQKILGFLLGKGAGQAAM